MSLPQPRTGKREESIQLNDHGGLMSGFVDDAEGFLLGPRGEVWDLHPWVGCVPRLLVETVDERPSLTLSPEQPRELRFSIFHQSRYLALFAVTERLEPGIRCWQGKNGDLELGARDGGPVLLDCHQHDRAGERVQLAGLDGGHWVSAGRSPYLLVCQRSANLERLLAFARHFSLPQGKPPLWSQPFVTSPRTRLSALADRQLAVLRRQTQLRPQVAQ